MRRQAESAARRAMSCIRGETAADFLLLRIRRDLAMPDELAAQVQQFGDDADARAGFLRRVQKAIRASTTEPRVPGTVA